MSKKLGLALGGGGARGVAHIGVLQALEENGIKPDYISGTSMGTVVGACYAKGITILEMLDVVAKLKPLDIVDVGVNGMTKLGLLRSKKVEKLFLKYLGDATFEDLQIPFTCTATDILTGNLHVFSSGSLVTAIQASIAIPSIFRPVAYEDMLLVDGGVLCRVPVKQVKDMGADVVIASDVLINTARKVEKPKNVIALLMRTFDVMDNNATGLAYEKYADICDIRLEPEMKGINQYVVKDLMRAYDEGYKTAMGQMDKIKELLN